jgi:hypothetical protein
VHHLAEKLHILEDHVCQSVESESFEACPGKHCQWYSTPLRRWWCTLLCYPCYRGIHLWTVIHVFHVHLRILTYPAPICRGDFIHCL